MHILSNISVRDQLLILPPDIAVVAAGTEVPRSFLTLFTLVVLLLVSDRQDS